MRAWKIFALERDKLKFLFHGLRGSRTVPLGEWLLAERKLNVRDGRGKFRYESGFHAFILEDEAWRWEGRFRVPRVLVSVAVLGPREKPSRAGTDMKLFDRMYVPKSPAMEPYGGGQ